MAARVPRRQKGPPLSASRRVLRQRHRPPLGLREPQVREKLVYADAAKAALDSARVALPAFDNATRVADLFNEQVHLAVLGQKTPEQAMADADAAIQPLLPA